jgi:amidase
MMPQDADDRGVVSHSPTYKLLVPSSWLGPIEDLLTVEKPLLAYTRR